METGLSRFFEIIFASFFLVSGGAAEGAGSVKNAFSEPELETCSGDGQYSRLSFDFEEDWMNRYSFWIEDTWPIRGKSAEIGGIRFTGKVEVPISVRMYGQNGVCIFQAKTYSLEASSVALFENVFGPEFLETPIHRALDVNETTGIGPDPTQVIRVALGILRPFGTSNLEYHYSFAV